MGREHFIQGYEDCKMTGGTIRLLSGPGTVKVVVA